MSNPRQLSLLGWLQWLNTKMICFVCGVQCPNEGHMDLSVQNFFLKILRVFLWHLSGWECGIQPRNLHVLLYNSTRNLANSTMPLFQEINGPSMRAETFAFSTADAERILFPTYRCLAPLRRGNENKSWYTWRRENSATPYWGSEWIP